MQAIAVGQVIICDYPLHGDMNAPKCEQVGIVERVSEKFVIVKKDGNIFRTLQFSKIRGPILVE